MSKNVLENEKILLLELSEGSVLAFRRIFDFYKALIYDTAVKLTKSPEIAEEIVQDVFTAVWQMRNRLPEIENLGGYIRIMARNRAFKELKRIAAESEFNHSLPKSDVVDTVVEHVMLNDTMGVFKKAIQTLPKRQRSVYELCHFEGLKYHEAAARLNISVFTVKTHMQQALFSVRKYMSSYQNLPVLIFLLSKFIKT